MPRDYLFFVCIMSSLSGTLYVGVSNNVYARSGQHKTGIGSAFCRKYGIDRLVYYEEHRYIRNAIARETQSRNGGARRRSR